MEHWSNFLQKGAGPLLLVCGSLQVVTACGLTVSVTLGRWLHLLSPKVHNLGSADLLLGALYLSPLFLDVLLSILCFVFDLCPRWRHPCVANDLSTEKAHDPGLCSLFVDLGSVSCGLCVSHTAAHLPALLAPNPDISFLFAFNNFIEF